MRTRRFQEDLDAALGRAGDAVVSVLMVFTEDRNCRAERPY